MMGRGRSARNTRAGVGGAAGGRAGFAPYAESGSPRPGGLAVPAETWSEFVRMSGCALAVAGVAVPVGLTAWAVARRHGDRLLPGPRGWRVPWGGFEVFAALLVVSQIVPLLVGSALTASGVIEHVYAP